jgi:hypothetical protein
MKNKNQNQKIKDTAADVEILIHFSGCSQIKQSMLVLRLDETRWRHWDV